MPVTVSIADSEDGPIPKQVTVPGGTSVRPASVIKLDIKHRNLHKKFFKYLRSKNIYVKTFFFPIT